MRKVVIQRPGSYDRLRLEEHPDPAPAAGEVVVRAAAIGVNYADVVVRMGLYASAKKYVGWPITPGFEVAGEVAALGPEVTDLTPGQSVLCVTRFGGYATHVRVPRRQVFPLPAGFSVAEAAAFPAVFLTAYYALHRLAHPRAGETLLVHSAAGGVGGALLQLARIQGCRTLAVVGASHKIDAARACGADAVIDKRRQPLWPTVRALAPRGCDVVLDANGAATLRASYRHLAPAGRLVVYGFHSMLPRRGGRPRWGRLLVDYLRTPRFNPLQLTGDNKSVLAFNLSYLFDRQDLLAEAMQQLLGWAAAGRLAPPPVTSYPLDAVARAHRDLESGQTVGKLVLIP